MRVYKILGRRSGFLDPSQWILIFCSAFVVLFFDSVILFILLPLFSFIVSYLMKKNFFQEREEWPLLLFRMVFRPQGWYNLNDKDRI